MLRLGKSQFMRGEKTEGDGGSWAALALYKLWYLGKGSLE